MRSIIKKRSHGSMLERMTCNEQAKGHNPVRVIRWCWEGHTICTLWKPQLLLRYQSSCSVSSTVEVVRHLLTETDPSFSLCNIDEILANEFLTAKNLYSQQQKVAGLIITMMNNKIKLQLTITTPSLQFVTLLV